MFDLLTEKLTGVFQRLGRKGRLTEEDVDSALREIRLALLEADVHFRVVRDLTARVRERAVGEEVLRGVNPAHQVARIVYEELVRVLGGEPAPLRRALRPPTVVMLVGLQGSGKTTTCAKLALHLRRQGGQTSLLVAGDLRRPAAVEQLVTLGRQLGVPVYHEDPATATPVEVARRGLEAARRQGAQWVLLDTGGRLHIDDALMEELTALKEAVQPTEVLLVVDAMTGQDALRSAEAFHRWVGLTGLILTKLDGDARGGSALSIRAVTGLPIKFVGVGEKPDALEPFHPDRLASRILGMGDVLTLVEKARQAIDEERARDLERKLRRAEFTLEDFLEQLRALRRMGSLQQTLEMLPGAHLLKRRLSQVELDERALKRMEAIILSMTPQERRNPDLLNASRKRRIARGSGTTVQQVNELLAQYRQAREMVKRLSRMRDPRALMRMLRL